MNTIDDSFKTGNHNQKSSDIKIFKRDELKSLHKVVSKNKEHNLGILKDLRSQPEIQRFIPENARLAISWVHLAKNEKLATHVHPIDSFYVITEGEVILLGEKDGTVAKAGDIILIPKNCSHGFIGSGPDGYWGLSIQFEKSGLYEHPDKPLVEFTDKGTKSYFERLQENNEKHLSTFKKNPLFRKIHEIKHQPEKKKRFLAYFQELSNMFQRMVLLRSGLCEDGQFEPHFWKHLEEEFGHNKKLLAARKDEKPLEDPIFEALCLWFTHQMLTLGNLEKLFLVNFIIETSAIEFYNRANHVFHDFGAEHFESHVEHDSGHAQIGQSLFEEINESTYTSLIRLQNKAWNMIDQQYYRLAQLME